MVSLQELEQARSQNRAALLLVKKRESQVKSKSSLRSSVGAEGVQQRRASLSQLGKAEQSIGQSQQEIAKTEQLVQEQESIASRVAAINNAIRERLSTGKASAIYRSLAKADRAIVDKISEEISAPREREAVRVLKSEAVNEAQKAFGVSFSPAARAKIEKQVDDQLKQGKINIDIAFPTSKAGIGGGLDFTRKINIPASVPSTEIAGRIKSEVQATPSSIGPVTLRQRALGITRAAGEKIQDLNDSVNYYLNALIPDKKEAFVNKEKKMSVIGPTQKLELQLKNLQSKVEKGDITSEQAEEQARKLQNNFEVSQAKRNAGRQFARGAVVGTIASLAPPIGLALGVLGGASIAKEVSDIALYRPQINRKALAIETGAFLAGGLVGGGAAGSLKARNVKLTPEEFQDKPISVTSPNLREQFITKAAEVSGDKAFQMLSKQKKFSDAEVYQIPLKDGRSWVVVKYSKATAEVTGEGTGPVLGRSGFIGFELKPDVKLGTIIGRRMIGATESIAEGDIAQAYTRAVVLKPKGNFVSNILDKINPSRKGEVINILERIQRLNSMRARNTSAETIKSVSRRIENESNKLQLIKESIELLEKHNKGRKVTLEDIHRVFNLDRLARGAEPFTKEEFAKASNQTALKGVIGRVFTKYKIPLKPQISKSGEIEIISATAERRGILAGKFRQVVSGGKSFAEKLEAKKLMKPGRSELIERYKKAQASMQAKRSAQIQKLKSQRLRTLRKEAVAFGGAGTILQAVKAAEVSRARTLGIFRGRGRVPIKTGTRSLAREAVRSQSQLSLRPYKEGIATKDAGRLKPRAAQQNQVRLDVNRKTKLRPYSDVVQVPKSGERLIERPAQASLQRQAQSQRQQQRPRQRQAPQVILRHRDEFARATRPRLPLLPLKKEVVFKSKIHPESRAKQQKKYDVFVRRKGKFFRANPVPLTKKAALGTGLRIVDTTLAASTTVRETKRSGFRKNLAAERYGTKLLSKFVPSKRERGVLVEKSRFRLERSSLTPEVREIKAFARYKR